MSTFCFGGAAAMLVAGLLNEFSDDGGNNKFRGTLGWACMAFVALGAVFVPR